MKIKTMLLLGFVILFSNLALATSYPYNQEIPILNQGKEIGYVSPYYQSTILGNYAYLKWQRYGFPIGDSFPIALIEGTITALPFGINGEFLKIKINKITNSNIDLTIDQSSISQELENTLNNAEEDMNKQINEVTKQTKPIFTSVQNELEKLNSQLELRAQKAIDRDYHTSLHIIDITNKKLEETSNIIKQKEAELAEEIEDKIIYLLLESFVSPGSGISYTSFISQIPSEIRHDITNYIYNIDSKQDNLNEAELATNGVTTIYIGNPIQNKVSAAFNNQLKNLDLPYFENNKIIGKRTYSSDDIGIIAAIPEEKYLDKTTLQKRWDNNKIRLYKTLIAGIGNEGLDASTLWYTKQLDLAKNTVKSGATITAGAIDGSKLEINEILSGIGNIIKSDPKASIGFGTIAQGWVLAGINSLQNSNIERIDSLGYVIIVKKEGNNYRTLETYSLVGYTKNYFLDEYQEVINKVEDVTDKTKIIENDNKNSEEISKNLNKKTKGNFIIIFFKNIWGLFF